MYIRVLRTAASVKKGVFHYIRPKATAAAAAKTFYILMQKPFTASDTPGAIRFDAEKLNEILLLHGIL